MKNRLYIWEIPIDKINMSEAKNRLKEILDKDDLDIVVTPNPEIIMSALKDKELKTLLQNASLALPDGISIVHASKIMGQPLEERITGVDFLSRVLETLNQEKKGIYLLGGKASPEGEKNVAEKAGENMKEKYPDLIISGSHHGYFGKDEEGAIVKEIQESGASFLCVAMGSPRQEKFISRNKSNLSNIRGAMGVGGSLDVWAGTVARAPVFYQDHGIEWLYRLIKEPVRIKRMAKLPFFIVRVLVTKGK